jgi:tryptophan-rich sensory protein
MVSTAAATAVTFAPLVLGLGVGALTPMHPEWYATLQKPSWNPPGWVFGPVWTALYLLMGLAARRVVRRTGLLTLPMLLFAIQLGLNVAWSPVFFGQKKPREALVLLGLIVGTAVATAIAFGRVDRTAGLLLLPYLAWLALAFSLNRAIVVRNPGA